MKAWNHKFWLCLSGTVLLAAGVIFLPRYLSRSLDLRGQNQVVVLERGDFAFVEPSSNMVQETIQAFQKLNDQDSEVTLLGTFDQSSRMNNNLLEQVFDQAMYAADIGLLPVIGSSGYDLSNMLGLELIPYDYWVDKMQMAQYYSLTYTSDSVDNTKEMLNFWYLSFGDNKTFRYSFVINAVTYQIYYAELYNSVTDAVADYIDIYWNGEDSYTNEEAEKNKQMLEKEIMPYDTYLFDSNVWYILTNEYYGSGCLEYYEANDYKLVNVFSSSSRMNDRLSIVVLNYDTSSVYVEQKILAENEFGLQGIGIGIQNLGDDIHKLAD